MRTKRELYQEAMRAVALWRQTARANAEDARAAAEAAVPALRHAEEEVRVRGVRCALAGASGKDRTAAAAALAKAKQDLTALLASSGRPADALEPHFTCKKCQDTGTFEGHTCICVHKLMQKLRREEIESLSSLSISSFDTMELRYYPNTMDDKLGEPVRSYMGSLLAELRAYAEEFDRSSESLMLFGNGAWARPTRPLPLRVSCWKRTSMSFMCPARTFSPSWKHCTLAQTPAARRKPCCRPQPGPTCSFWTTWAPSSIPASS